MKKTVLLSFLLFFGYIFTLQAQIGLQLSYLGPYGDMKYVLKPAPCLEVILGVSDINSRFNYAMTLGISKFSATQDTFHTVTYTNAGGASIIPSSQVIKTYWVVPIGLTFEYKFLSNKFSPMAGLDAKFYVIEYEGYSDVPGVISSESAENLWQTGIMPKIGLSYIYNDNILLTAGTGKSYGLTGIADPLNYWKTFIRVSQNF